MATSVQSEATEEELATYRAAFDSYDLNGDGVIDVEELHLGLEQMGGQRRNRSSVYNLMVKVDNGTDSKAKDVLMTFDAFVELMRSKDLEEFFEKGQKTPTDDKGASLESIYGQTPTPEETPDLLEEKQKEFEKEINRIPAKKKQGYTQALEKCPDLVKDRKFKLVFLRCEVLNVEAAVARFVLYWDKRIELFGTEKAFLPLTLDGALKDDHVALTEGRGLVRLTGHKDRDGRAILFGDFTTGDNGKYERRSLARAFWYMVHAALEDEDSQKRGVVGLFNTVHNLSQWDPLATKSMAYYCRGVLPIRVAALHICHPTSVINVVVKTTKLFLGPKLRKRLYVHKGSNEKVIETLATYGISNDALPTMWGGNLVMDHSEWLNERRETQK